MGAVIIIYLTTVATCLISLGLSNPHESKYSYVRTLVISAIWPVSIPYILIKKHRRSQNAA